MKELSIEEKAKRYDEALEKARLVLQERGNEPDGASILSKLFPELRESEDEKIRKCITLLVNGLTNEHFVRCGASLDEIKAWLEKQNSLMKCLQISNARIGELIEKNYYLKEQLEEKGEQKPTDKVEPKFHEGDWINGYYTNYKVLSVNDKWYVVEDVNGNKINILFENEKFHHLWTIKDARDGDVLACNISYYDNPFVCIFNRINETCDDGDFDSHCYVTASRKEYDRFFVCRDNDDRADACVGHSCQDIHPANYYEKKLLFDKMREAGYEWDAKKKKLYKLKDVFIAEPFGERHVQEKEEVESEQENIQDFKELERNGKDELTEFEKELIEIIGHSISQSAITPDMSIIEFAKQYSDKLLAIARKSFVAEVEEYVSSANKLLSKDMYLMALNDILEHIKEGGEK